jgi:hypothetical protein
MHHKGGGSHHLSASAQQHHHDQSSWVAGLTALREGDQAVGLLTHEEAATVAGAGPAKVGVGVRVGGWMGWGE